MRGWKMGGEPPKERWILWIYGDRSGSGILGCFTNVEGRRGWYEADGGFYGEELPSDWETRYWRKMPKAFVSHWDDWSREDEPA